MMPSSLKKISDKLDLSLHLALKWHNIDIGNNNFRQEMNVWKSLLPKITNPLANKQR